MAELVGVIASGIGIGTFAVQIASSLAKLKDFWSQIKETPEDIQMLVEELKDLQLLLCDIQDDRAQNPMSSALLDQVSVSKCIQHCQRGVDRLKALVDDLENDVLRQNGLKRKWASAKVVLDKSKVNKYKSRLESSVRLLSLAYQCYTRALIQQQPDIIITRMTEIMTTIRMPTQNPPIDSHGSVSSTSSTIVESDHPFEVEKHASIYSSYSNPQYYSRRSGRRQQITAKCQFQAKLLNRAWAFQFLNNVSGWKFQIRTYTFISNDSPVIRHIQAGHIEGIQELFSKRLVSLNDIDSYGWSLLELAALWGHLGVCQFLLEQGADVNLSVESPDRAPEFWILHGWSGYQPPGAAINGILMLRHDDMEITTSTLWDFRGPVDEFKHLPLEERVDVALVLMNVRRRGKDAELVRVALGPGPVSPEAIKYKMEDGETLLHAVARVLGYEWCLRYRNKRYFSGWLDLAKELIEGGADLHGLWQNNWELVEVEDSERQPIYATPLICLFQGFSDDRFSCSHEDLPQKPQVPLEIWLEILQSAGVDLLQYGRKEAKLRKKQSIEREIPLFLNWYGGKGDCIESRHTWTTDYLQLDELSYGSSVADWKFPEFDSMAVWSGEFWGSVEREMTRLAESKSRPTVLTTEMPMPVMWGSNLGVLLDRTEYGRALWEVSLGRKILMEAVREKGLGGW